MKTLLITSLVVLGLAPALARADAPFTCAKRSDLAGPCYQVHGRLNAWNGNPAERIWVIGTKHTLGVSKPYVEEELMPKGLIDQLDSFWTEIYADFTVCPFDKDIPGHMGHVCIDSAKNILVERFADPDGKGQGTYTKVGDIKG
jgi:hypothetical protein